MLLWDFETKQSSAFWAYLVASLLGEQHTCLNNAFLAVHITAWLPPTFTRWYIRDVFLQSAFSSVVCLQASSFSTYVFYALSLQARVRTELFGCA
jgi:hypothetical protein